MCVLSSPSLIILTLPPGVSPPYSWLKKSRSTSGGIESSAMVMEYRGEHSELSLGVKENCGAVELSHN